MKICILLVVIVVLAGATDYAPGQRAWLVVSGRECIKLDWGKLELWFPMVDGRPDKAHGELRHVLVDYDPNCGVYRVERVESRK